MNPKTRSTSEIVIFAIALLALTVGFEFIGFAEEGKPQFKKHAPGQMMKEKADANKDGKIDEVERKAIKEQWQANKEKRKEEIAKKLDTNQDGKVDQQEWKAAREEKKEQWQEKKKEWIENHPQVKDKIDYNNDGTVEKKEWKQAKKEWKENHPFRKDFDNNPPGPKGGAGTNWENRPGPKGGPGASPDKRHSHR